MRAAYGSAPWPGHILGWADCPAPSAGEAAGDLLDALKALRGAMARAQNQPIVFAHTYGGAMTGPDEGADLGPGWHQKKTDRDKKIRGHLRQLQAPGLQVTVTDTAA